VRDLGDKDKATELFSLDSAPDLGVARSRL
jgi:hypothetical protein